MAETSAIAWTRSTFNPWIGCTKVGPGCDHCYAEALDKRANFGKTGPHWGAGVPRYRTGVKNWKGPLEWEKKAAAGDKPWLVFCASLADVGDNEVPNEWRDDLWTLIEATPNLSWLLVTKRIGNVKQFVWPAWIAEGFPPNVRLLITVCNQEEADRDIPKLLALPCKNGVSYEPALGAVNWAPWLTPCGPGIVSPDPHGRDRALQWLIVGGESTQGAGKARPFDLAWARSTVAQCKAAGVPVFVKQVGSRPVTGSPDDDYLVVGRHFNDSRLKDRAGADPAEWPESLRVQEFPAERVLEPA